ncbi:uncharacterized protein F5147DRAFT_649850 [Suillus discolor]|uniref:Uncharacterized protein n=1 Tax=Suillus discolor TaxID=1912936 RepID=A0A9P7JXR1_9AGAM|nr:uncharacterized protein F5147DRAFT_649850 [Suillus discolor]KAG2114688.1 hypothetical protein F5147DRAFT_649850 [Suillus discolor]
MSAGFPVHRTSSYSFWKLRARTRVMGTAHALWGTDGVIIATNNAGPLIYSTNPVKTFPKQVVFGEKTDVVVGGSDTSIFDKNEGTLKQVWKHADKARVQTVISGHLTDYKTYDGAYHSIIVGATSQNNAEPVISIWSCQWDNLKIACPLGKALKNFYVAMNTSISFKSLGNIWQNLAQLCEPTNDDIHAWVE